MPWLLPALVIGLPLIELYTFVRVAGAVGFLPALAAAIGAGLLGIALLRRQGLATLMRAQDAARQGRLPVVEALDGILLAVAGGLLLLPGFISDIFALLLLLPPVRALIRQWLGTGMAVQPSGQPSGPTVLDGDFTVVDDDRPPPPRLPPDRGDLDPRG